MVVKLLESDIRKHQSTEKLRANVIKSAVMVFFKDAVMVVGSGASIVFQKYLPIVI